MRNDYLDYLEHHGILGQKHGIRNGPPYPLSPEDYSAQEKRLNKVTKQHDKYESKANKLKMKSAKLDLKSAKLEKKSLKAERKGDSETEFKYSDKAVKFAKKSAQLEVKSLKYSKKAEKFAKQMSEIKTDLDISDKSSNEYYIKLKEKALKDLSEYGKTLPNNKDGYYYRDSVQDFFVDHQEYKEVKNMIDKYEGFDAIVKYK